MLRKIGTLGLVAILATMQLSFSPAKGWFASGTKPDSYDMGMDNSVFHNGKAAGTIKSIKKKIDGFGALLQNSKPDQYLGKRVKMSGYIKATNVDGWAGLWLRIDQKGDNRTLAYASMHKNKIQGSIDWQPFDVVLDVPAEAGSMIFGVMLAGTGQVWFDDIQFEEVSDQVPITGIMFNDRLEEPANLNFEE